MQEIWKDIKGYEGLYQISNLGNVRSLDRYVEDNIKTQFIKGKRLKPFGNGNGYLVISLLKNGKRKNKYIHRLVAEYFIDGYDEDKVINHKDFNRENNDISNLEIVSQKENVMYSLKKGRYEKAYKVITAKHIKRAQDKILNNKEDILKMYENGASINEISKLYHIKFENLSKFIKERLKWTILCIETNEKFDSIKQANDKYGVTTIKDAISGRQKTSANYHWKKYIEEVR